MPDRLPAGFGVLVTRPEDQAAELVAAVEKGGGRAYRMPALEIRPRTSRDIEADAAKLPEADITIFISRNAVTHGLPYASGRLAAIGPATAAAIADAGRHVDICPAAGFDSEHLLAETDFTSAQGLVVRIIRGNGGREHLARELRARGARVDYLAAYERRIPEVPGDDMRRLESLLSRGEIDAVVVMSMETLGNLRALLSPAAREALAGTPLVSPAARVLKKAGGLFPACPVYPAEGPGTSDIVDALAGLAHGSANQDEFHE